MINLLDIIHCKNDNYYSPEQEGLSVMDPPVLNIQPYCNHIHFIIVMSRMAKDRFVVLRTQSKALVHLSMRRDESQKERY